MKHTISVLVENHAGVLSRVSGLFSRRGFNIDSLAVGVTDDPAISRITIVAEGDEHTAQQLEKQLNKLIDAIKVKTLAKDELLSRELQLIKINANPQQRGEILTIEVCDTTIHLQRFNELIRPYGIKEVVRTGVIAIHKGSDILRK